MMQMFLPKQSRTEVVSFYEDNFCSHAQNESLVASSSTAFSYSEAYVGRLGAELSK